MPPSFWQGRRVLVTGHTGFKGAWLCLWLERLGAEVVGLSLAPESPAGAFAAFQPWNRLDSRVVDLRDREATARLVASTRPEIIFHLGAQALVHRGWEDPSGTYAVNVLGTSHILEAVSRVEATKAVVVVTSDKVYANSGTDGPFAEDSPLGGDDPYSASKAAAELVVRAWRSANPARPVVTVRAGNVIGGGDTAAERLLPDAWRAVQSGRDLVLRHPTAIRPWQFVLEPLYGYLLVAETLATEPARCPPALNFGPDSSGCWTVARVTDATFAACNTGRWIVGSPPGGPPESPAITLDSRLAARVLGWHPRLDPETAILWTVEWWRGACRRASLRSLAHDQIQAYQDMLG